MNGTGRVGLLRRRPKPPTPSAARSSAVFHAVRVAAIAALVIGAVYATAIVAFDLINNDRLTAQVDAHLRDSMSDLLHRGDLRAEPGSIDEDGGDFETTPVFFWRVEGSGRSAKAVALNTGIVPLPHGTWSESGGPSTAAINGRTFRLLAARVDRTWIVAGQSLTETRHLQSALARAELLGGPVVVVAVFLGALIIGLKAARPIEQARLRQLEFTADASHELRTPLSVIEAEVDLALASPRHPGEYRDTLEQVGQEGQRLRRIVEDLLWLARFDSAPPPPGDEPVDLPTVVRGCAERFSAVAQARGIELSVEGGEDGPLLISAPPDWIDRLTGVLVDNACRYAGSGGEVRVSVEAQLNRVYLIVEDSGPGIPLEERPRLFDRFHRATDGGEGAGLGLAIADAVVRSSGGRWHVDDSPLGGAYMEVSWRRTYLKSFHDTLDGVDPRADIAPTGPTGSV